MQQDRKEEEQRQQAHETNNVFKHIFTDVLKQQSLVHNQISSFDDFVGSEFGVKNILKNMFRINNIVQVEQGKIIQGKDGQYEVGSIEILVTFDNVQIRENNIEQEEIHDLSQEQDQVNRQKYIVQDINLPVNCRKQARTLKLDLLSDIDIKLQVWSEPGGKGVILDVRKEQLQNQLIVQIPLMIGSKFCHVSHKNKEQRIKLQEDPLDLGGYFIIKGNEWSCDFTESIKYNELQIRNIQKNKMINGFVMSKQGDTYEPSFNSIVQFNYKTGQIASTIDSYERLHFILVPFFLIFKLFGITNQKEMTEMILEDDIKSEDNISQHIKSIIQQAVDNQYLLFENASQLQTPEQVSQKIADVLNSENIRKKLLDSQLVYTSERVRDTFHGYFLLHLGSTSLDSNVKMRYYGSMIKRILVAHITQQFPDPHTYLEKRIHATGQNLAKMFKKSFNHQVIAQVKQQVIRELQKVRDIHKVDCVHIIQKQLSTSIQNKILQKPIISGSPSDMAKSGTIQMKRRIQSQGLNRKNIINSISQMRMINNQKQSLDKMSKKIIEQRSVQPSFAGYVCIVQSSDNGEKAGKVKSLASLSVITNSQPSSETIDLLWELIPDMLYDVNIFQSKDVKKYALQKVFVNGFWIGFIQRKSMDLAIQVLRDYRRENYHKWKYLTISINEEGEMHIYSDYGRLLVPLIIVHYNEKGYPYTNLNTERIEYIMSGKADIEWYLENQIFEYISIEESHNCLVAESPESFLKKTQKELFDNIQTRYHFTHILIPQSLFGLVGLLSPFANHAQTKRITMFTNQAKQGCGWAMYNYPFRMDKSMLIQQYVSQPSVRTIIHDFFPPNGQQLIVAYTMYDGFNQEDSVIINKGSVDQGLLNAVYYTYEETQIKYNEYIDNITGTQPPNQYGNYMKLNNGIIRNHIWISKDDVLVSKKEQSRSGEPHSTSLIYKGTENAYVEDVMVFYDESSVKNIRIKLKIIRNLKQGDKMSSGQGCKCIVSKTLLPHEMPFTNDGLVPDLIYNPHSVPTRMMIGQLLEATFQLICSKMCDTIDATVFSDISIELADQLMKQFGIKDQGYRYLYNGDTGERIKSQIFIVPTFYYRLQKFSVAGKYIVDQSTIDLATRQAGANRATRGGQRLGEMELVSFYSSQTANILAEKAFTHSDHYDSKVCRNCGQLADMNTNQKYQVYYCSSCGDKTEICNVESAWSSTIFKSTLNSMGINIKTMPQQPIIEENQ